MIDVERTNRLSVNEQGLSRLKLTPICGADQIMAHSRCCPWTSGGRVQLSLFDDLHASRLFELGGVALHEDPVFDSVACAQVTHA